MFSARLVAYTPAGVRLPDALLEGVSWDAQMPLNDVAALSLSYPSVADVMGLASEPVEIAVEVSNGGDWVEPRNARFLSSEINADLVQPLDVPQIKMRGLGALLERPMILRKSENAGKPYNSDGKRNFLSATAGQIITSIIQESRSRYSTMLQGITLGFTASKDSLGNNWNKLDSVAYEPGTDLLRILEDMVSRGICDWWMDGRTLHACNAEAGSTKRNTLSVPLLDAAEAPVRITHEGRATHVAVEGGGGRVWEKPVPGAQVPYGAKIIRTANDSITTQGTANDLIDRQIVQAQGSRREYTTSLALIDFAPFLDFVVGDWLMAKTESPTADSAGWESVRVHAVTLRWSAKDAVLTGDLTLNDRFIDASIRDSKRLKGIAHGTTQNLGDGGVPSRSDKAIPAAPTGVSANSLGYWQDVIPLSSVDVSWQAVTADVDGLALNGVEAYEVRVGGQTKRVSGTSAGFDGLQPSRIYDVTVRAISTTGILGRWSAVTSVTTAYPLPNLDPPTVPILTSENGALSVDWDGKLQPASGNPYTPPKHFSHVLVEVQKVGSGAWTKYARDQGTVLVGLTAGDQWRARLYAVDMLGNESTAGAQATITISSEARQALTVAQGAADSAGQAQTTANGANARMSGTSATGPVSRPNGTPLIQGDEYVRYKGSVASGNAVEVLVWNGSEWTKSYALASQILVLSSNGTIELGEGVVAAPQIRALTIQSEHMSVGALDAFRIRSPLFESVATANRGIKWIGNQFVAWDNNGKEMFRLAGNTGEISGMTITGGVIRTALSGARIVIKGGSYGDLNMFDAAGTRRTGLGWSTAGDPGLWMYDSAGVTRLALVSNGTLTFSDSARTRSLRISTVASSGGYSRASFSGPSYGGAYAQQRFYTKDVSGGTRVGIQLTVQTDAGDIREGDPYLVIENGHRWTLGSKKVQISSQEGQKIGLWAPGGLFYYGAPTSTSAANAIIAVTPSGGFYRSTSLRKYKHDIQDSPSDPSLLDLRIRTWVDKQQAIDRAFIIERNANREAAGQFDQLEVVPDLKRISGVIAEEVWDLTGREELVTWDENGDMQGVPYERLGLEYARAIYEWAQKEIGALRNELTKIKEQ